jgi:hypothetical protein
MALEKTAQMDKAARLEFTRKLRPFIEGGDYEKVASQITPYVRVRLYEESFADNILAVRQVTEAELIPEIEEDSYYVITNVEQGTKRAVVANFMDRPSEDIIAGKRYKIPLGKHMSRQARKLKDELLAYNYDILQDAVEKDIFELGMLRDWKLINVFNECVRLSGKMHADVTNVASSGPVQIDKVHTNRLESVLNSGGRSGMPSRDELKTTRFLFNDHTRRDYPLLDTQTLGYNLAEDMFVNGMTVKTLQGITYISSIKNILLTEHEHVTLLTFASASPASATSVFVEGVTFTVPTSTPAASIAANVATQINASSNPAIRQTVDEATLVHVRAEVTATNQLRIIRSVVANNDTQAFEAPEPVVNFSAISGVTTAKGYDRYDIVWAFPDPEFMGEIVRVAGRDIEPEVWYTPGESMVNRVLREWFGMGMGNVNGVAKLRMQRARFLG